MTGLQAQKRPEGRRGGQRIPHNWRAAKSVGAEGVGWRLEVVLGG